MSKTTTCGRDIQGFSSLKMVPGSETSWPALVCAGSCSLDISFRSFRSCVHEFDDVSGVNKFVNGVDADLRRCFDMPCVEEKRRSRSQRHAV